MAFLEQYFGLFDSDDRSPLMDAYHENVSSLLAIISQARVFNVFNLDSVKSKIESEMWYPRHEVAN